MSYKGRFKPKNYQKYKGDPTNIIYRSLWERKFMNYCDLTENVSEWQSEEFWIPYISPKDNRVHRYFPDFYIKTKNGDKVFPKFSKGPSRYYKGQSQSPPTERANPQGLRF